MRLLEGGKILGTAAADSAGNWTITSSTLADGVHNIAAQAVDAAGNTGPVSQALAVTIDTVNPTIALFSQRAVGDVVGDTNGDLDCNLQDLLNVLNNFGKSGLGDTNGDGIVDAQDRANVVNHLGQNVSVAGGGSIAQTAFVQVDSALTAAAPIAVETAFTLPATVAVPAETSASFNWQPATEQTSSTARSASRQTLSITESEFVAVGLPPTIGVEVQRWTNVAAAGTDLASNGDALNSPAKPFTAPESARALDEFFEQLPFDTADATVRPSSGAQDNSGFDFHLDDFYAALADRPNDFETPDAASSIAG